MMLWGFWERKGLPQTQGSPEETNVSPQGEQRRASQVWQETGETKMPLQWTQRTSSSRVWLGSSETSRFSSQPESI